MDTGYSKWRKLDNAALAFPLVTGKDDTRVFRFYCQLKEKVDGEILQSALDQAMEKYPLFQAVLRKGLFWFYLEHRSLRANCEKMNQLVKVIITYDFADRTETVDRTLIKNWFGYDEDGNVILDENLVRQYVADLGLKYDTMGQTRTFLTYDNRQVEIKGGDYGWVIDQDEEVKALIAAIESGVTQVREPVYLYSGYSRGTNDIGSTYLEIDLTNQRLVFYQKGTPIVDTPIVSV